MKLNKKLFITLLVLMFLSIGAKIYSQPRPPVNPQGGPVNGNAPVGNELGILMALSGLYGSFKYYKAKKAN